MTYSIVARDPPTGELGVAVQTRWFNVGETVPWAEPGVGAVATQSFSESPTARSGWPGCARAPLPEALEALLAADRNAKSARSAWSTRPARSAAFTGARCVAAAGQLRPTASSRQHDGTPHRLAGDGRGLERRTETWPSDSLAALGGRGRRRRRPWSPVGCAPRRPCLGPAWATRYDLRVEDHRAPLDELARLLRLARAYEAFDRSEEPAMAGDLSGGGGDGDRPRPRPGR